ncbi:proline-rich protein 5 [Eublepharis macularius]|uniref:Proline-rich protein 5 n=1 Tax=Eublepharis macularius TaxID=481883 RepID=A0AA97KGZ8_EUBMA|nr:proline-rich protein 5 [Eublepharis macularius]XP_054856838.1 proline-rich protein 5 [Eublepharis macularius]
MRTLRRLKFMSSPSLSDLGKREQAALDERGTQQRRACSNATWNSIHNGVIAVFQRKGLPEHELYNLNDGVRQLLKTELGSFFTEYLQNQLLTKGMVILRDKIRFYEGQKLLDTLAETWDFFFSDVLPMLQAIFYPVQGKEPSVRQLALLHFRNIITLNIKLEDALSRSRARVPPSIIQMLLILQGVHESKGVTEDYLKLEYLIQKVVSPYLGTYGLYSSEGPISHSSCILEKQFFRCSKSADVLAKNPVVRSKSYNNPLLTPVAEYESEAAVPNSSGIRRHSVSEMTLCMEMQDYASLMTIMDSSSKNSMAATKNSILGEPERLPTGSVQCTGHLKSPEPPKGLSYPGDDQNRAFELARDPDARAIAPTASPENIVDQILESIESDSDGIFIGFGQSCSSSSGCNVDVNSQSIV